jgi:hypothetical protein
MGEGTSVKDTARTQYFNSENSKQIFEIAQFLFWEYINGIFVAMH